MWRSVLAHRRQTPCKASSSFLPCQPQRLACCTVVKLAEYDIFLAPTVRSTRPPDELQILTAGEKDCLGPGVGIHVMDPCPTQAHTTKNRMAWSTAMPIQYVPTATRMNFMCEWECGCAQQDVH